MQRPYIKSSAGCFAVSLGMAMALALPEPASGQVVREAAGDVVTGVGRGGRFVGRTAVRTAEYTGGAAHRAGRVTWRGGRRVARGTGRAVVTVVQVPVRVVGGAARVVSSPFTGGRRIDSDDERMRRIEVIEYVPVRRAPRSVRYPDCGPMFGPWKG